jgi:hypothetical protein
MGMPQGELNPRLSRQGSNVDLDGGFEFTPHSSCLSWVKTGNARSEQMTSALPPKADSSRTSGHVRKVQPAQPVDATQALNLSAGVSNCKVSRGRSLS